MSLLARALVKTVGALPERAYIAAPAIAGGLGGLIASRNEKSWGKKALYAAGGALLAPVAFHGAIRGLSGLVRRENWRRLGLSEMGARLFPGGKFYPDTPAGRALLKIRGGKMGILFPLALSFGPTVGSMIGASVNPDDPIKGALTGLKSGAALSFFLGATPGFMSPTAKLRQMYLKGRGGSGKLLGRFTF